MDPVWAVASIAGTLCVGAASPGPSFVFVVRTSVASSRRAGVAAAVGMGLGGLTYGLLALAGLYALLAQVTWLFAALKVAGGLYLFWLASRIWRGASAPMQDVVASRLGTVKPASARRALVMGLTTQLSNPKTAVVYGGIFVAFLPAHPPSWVYLVLPPLLFGIEFVWYTLVACMFSSVHARAVYLRAHGKIDRVAATLIGGLGLRLAGEGLGL